MFKHVGEIMGNKYFSLKRESPIEDAMVSSLLYFNVPIKTQVVIGNYRADILIESDGKKMVVECDGEDFHQDAKREFERDKFLYENGYYVVHFSGKQIWRNAKKCVFDLIYEEFPSLTMSKEFREYQDMIENKIDKENKMLLLEDNINN